MMGWTSTILPTIDLSRAAEMYRLLFSVVRTGWVKTCHDVSDGGTIVALAESVIGSGLGADIKMSALLAAAHAYAPEPVGKDNAKLVERKDFCLFAEGPARLIVSVQPELRHEWENLWTGGFSCTLIGEVVQQDALIVRSDKGEIILSASCDELCGAWKTPLPFD